MTNLLPKPNSHSHMRLWMNVLVSGLAVALLLSQSLGRLHAIKHGGLASPHQVAALHETQHNAGFLEQLFSSHKTREECRLYDQLSDGHAMPAVAVVVLPVLMPSLAMVMLQGEAIRRWAALFDARGPPLTF